MRWAKKYGLKGPHAQCMLVMERNPEGVTSVQLGELCDKNKADVSRAVAVLEEKGLIMREAKNNSLYRARIHLTAEGKNAAEHVQRAAALAVEKPHSFEHSLDAEKIAVGIFFRARSEKAPLAAAKLNAKLLISRKSL